MALVDRSGEEKRSELAGSCARSRQGACLITAQQEVLFSSGTMLLDLPVPHSCRQ